VRYSFLDFGFIYACLLRAIVSHQKAKKQVAALRAATCFLAFYT